MMKQTIALSLALATASFALAQKAEYHIYAGSTHAHTAFTWSHGEMLQKTGCGGVRVYGLKPGTEVLYDWVDVNPKGGCFAMYVINGWQYHSPDVKLRPDWETVQGPPSVHFAKAKAAGFDWYVTSDHSQEAAFFPLGPNNPQWLASKREAAAATDKNFVALAGFEYSENNGPGGTGHFNVINSDDMLNALTPGVDLTYFYKWLATAKPNGSGPVVVSFNHPTVRSYADFTGRTPATTEVISMLEVINSNWHIHEAAFIKALDEGWKVAPTSGLDNHGLSGIPRMKSRAFVLATAKTKVAILEAMRHRRVYASLDNNIQCRYTVNGAIMGSTLQRPGVFRFDISVDNPDHADPKAKITRMEIVKDSGEVVDTFTPQQPSPTVHWTPTVRDTKAHYFFVRIWDAGGGDSPKPDPTKPMTWLAPVWTGVPSPMHPMLSLQEVKQRGGQGDQQ